METVLIIEDDPSILLGLQKNLKFEGYDVLAASDGERGLELAIDRPPDLIILDIMLPKISGFEICKTLKKNNIQVPIIILSAKDQEIDKIMGLDLGADDYVTKPFNIRELIARINAVMRRKRRYEQQGVPDRFKFGKLTLDMKGQTLLKDNEPLETSVREFKLLKFFVENRGKVLDRKEILNKVWGYDYFGTARTIDNFITKLRQKVEDDPDDPKHIVTVRGVGYKFVP
ncbi:MAG TPA: response regulator transcription factor [Planctomycetota bacterium]|jgi:DNA-binding response OmpR family regulator|nr:response regulator transcription factor [Planctomycetota bacterium]